MGVRYRTWLILLLLAGALGRVFLAFTTHGLVFDLDSYVLTERALGRHPLHVYTLLNGSRLYRWPYLTGFFPVLLLTQGLSHLTGLAFTSLVRVPAMLGDLAIAFVVQDFLGRRGAPPRLRLAAVAVVTFGPLFVVNAGYDGQFDSLAVLPALAALAYWERFPMSYRALIAGGLIGLGCALKTFPLLMVLALLPSCRSLRERGLLLAAALAVPALAIAPWLARDAHDVIAAVKYHSLAGVGGISLLAQPDLAGIWLGGPFPHLTAVSRALQGSLGTALLAVPLGAAALGAWRFRLGRVDASILLWLAVFACSVNFGPRYAIWGIPFFLMGAHVVKSLGLQVLLIVPTALLRAAPFADHGVLYVYVPLMLIAWLAFVVAAAMAARRLVQSPPVPSPSHHAGGN